MKETELSASAVVVAYYLLLSLFPLLLTVGNILPYLKINPDTVLPYLTEIIPGSIYEELKPAITSLLTQSSTSLLSFSALATLWSASRSVQGLQQAMNKAYGVKGRGNFIISKIISFLMMILLVVALAGVVLILGIGQSLLDWFQSIFNFSTDILDTFSALKWPVVIVVLFLIMIIIYRFLPNAKIKLKQVLPGALFSSIGWLLLSQVFGIYVKYFSTTISSYQIIGSFIVLMLWLNFAAIIIILGGVLNAVLAEINSGEKLAQREDLVARIKKRS